MLPAIRALDRWNQESNGRFLLISGKTSGRPGTETTLAPSLWQAWIRRGRCVCGSFIFVMTIGKIISYYHLTPFNKLYRPGQTIPLALGLITLTDGLGKIVRTAPVPESPAAEYRPAIRRNTTLRLKHRVGVPLTKSLVDWRLSENASWYEYYVYLLYIQENDTNLTA